MSPVFVQGTFTPQVHAHVGRTDATESAVGSIFEINVARADPLMRNAIGRHPCLDDSVVIPCESMWVTNFIGRDVDGVETGL